ncbi:MAG: 30S ribosomal protein S15 [Planctomycetia bacterium]|nr:30S ribosomal protein S15 [Planctomycetia bacterium]
MSITKECKRELVSKYRRSENDTGSAEVQIAILTKRINTLTSHFRDNRKDHAGRRGLLMLVGRRRSLLDYLKRTEPQRYLDIIHELEIRK